MNDNLTFTCSTFADLSPQTLYDILTLRIAVFMVEQKCFFTETDGYDPQALHLYAYNGDQSAIALYTRIFPPNHHCHGEVWDAARIGRVAVHEDFRGSGLGRAIMQESLKEIEKRFGKVPVMLSAQAHLSDFYTKLGFETQGEAYEEDGVPHIEMVRVA